MDVGAWLSDLGLAECAEAFATNGIDAAMLPELNNEDLKDLGVTRLADRKRLLKAIEELAGGANRDEPALTPMVTPVGERRQVTVLLPTSPVSPDSLAHSAQRPGFFVL